MPDWVIGLLVVGGLALLAALAHGILNYRRLKRQMGVIGREISSLSLAVWGQARKIVVLLLGSSVILVGVALLVLPGPAVVVIPLGVAILAIEFTWARRWLRTLRVHLHLSKRRMRAMSSKREKKVVPDS